MPFDPPLYLIGFAAGLAAGMVLIGFMYRGVNRSLKRTIDAHGREIAALRQQIRFHERENTHSLRIISEQSKAIRDSRRPPLPSTGAKPWPSPPKLAARASGGHIPPAPQPPIGQSPSSGLDSFVLGIVAGAALSGDSKASTPARVEHHHVAPETPSETRSSIDTGSSYSNDSYDSGSSSSGDSGGSGGGSE